MLCISDASISAPAATTASDPRAMLPALPNRPAARRRGICMSAPTPADRADSSIMTSWPTIGRTKSYPIVIWTRETINLNPTVRNDSNQIRASAHITSASKRRLQRPPPDAASVSCTGRANEVAPVAMKANSSDETNNFFVVKPAFRHTCPTTFTAHSVPRLQTPNTAASPVVLDSKGSPVAAATRRADSAKKTPSAVHTRPAPAPQLMEPRNASARISQSSCMPVSQAFGIMQYCRQ
mmetsp:Transcript_97304/g.297268  ORF Transcript_97304/g.297268 Transcript_97304/m.297268 type:complete len:238 (-) Transcript_97304:28-741(-)